MMKSTNVHMSSIFLSALGLGCAPVSADVFVEVTRAGELPNGLWETDSFGTIAMYDVWIWGTGADTDLHEMVFDIAGTDHQGNGLGTNVGWTVLALGQADPGGLFVLSEPGQLTGGYISGASLLTLPPPVGAPVPMGSSPASAIRVYAGFSAENIDVGGRLVAMPTLITTNAGTNPLVTSIGIVQTPSPGALATLAMAWVVSTRRRRSA